MTGWTKLSETKPCPKCEKILPLSAFNKCKRRGLQSWCRECKAEYHKEALSDPNGRRWRQRRLRVMRQAAEKGGFPCDLTHETLPYVPEACPCCGTALQVGRNGGLHNSPSYDRLCPELGYTEGNVVVLCVECNAIKNAAGPERILQVGRWLQGVLAMEDQPGG